MAARALGPFVRLAQLAQVFAEGKAATREIVALAKLPGEAKGKTAPEKNHGLLELKDISFGHDDAVAPLFEQLNLTLKPGEMMVVKGANAAGKTSFARLVTGLLQPTRGQVLLDGVNIAQLPPRWWANQLCYLPQDPTFIGASIKQNLLLARPDLSDRQINNIINKAGLADFLNSDPQGLDHPVNVRGDTISFGIRRRIALARALAVGGRIVIFDEPTEGLDELGRKHIARILKDMTAQKQTMILCTNDTGIAGQGWLGAGSGS